MWKHTQFNGFNELTKYFAVLKNGEGVMSMIGVSGKSALGIFDTL